MSWSELPTNLRTVLGAALLLVIGVAVASFTLSFIALREVAANQVTGWGHNAWIFRCASTPPCWPPRWSWSACR